MNETISHPNSYIILYTDDGKVKRFKTSGRMLVDARKEFERRNPNIKTKNIIRIYVNTN